MYHIERCIVHIRYSRLFYGCCASKKVEKDDTDTTDELSVDSNDDAPSSNKKVKIKTAPLPISPNHKNTMRPVSPAKKPPPSTPPADHFTVGNSEMTLQRANGMSPQSTLVSEGAGSPSAVSPAKGLLSLNSQDLSERTGSTTKRTQEWKPPEKKFEIKPATPHHSFANSLTCDALSPYNIVQSISSTCNDTQTACRPSKADASFFSGLINHFDSGSQTIDTRTYDTRLTQTTTATEANHQQRGKSGWSTIFDALSEGEDSTNVSTNNDSDSDSDVSSISEAERGSPVKR